MGNSEFEWDLMGITSDFDWLKVICYCVFLAFQRFVSAIWGIYWDEFWFRALRQIQVKWDYSRIGIGLWADSGHS